MEFPKIEIEFECVKCGDKTKTLGFDCKKCSINDKRDKINKVLKDWEDNEDHRIREREIAGAQRPANSNINSVRTRRLAGRDNWEISIEEEENEIDQVFRNVAQHESESTTASASLNFNARLNSLASTASPIRRITIRDEFSSSNDEIFIGRNRPRTRHPAGPGPSTSSRLAAIAHENLNLNL